MNAIEKYELWCDKLGDSHELSEELKSLKGNTKEIEERFAQDVAFGTAGLRGKVGAGSFCMNSLVVGRATQGLADFIRENGEEFCKRGVVICHDCRHFSKEFSEYAASILAANGIRAYTFPSLRPTPELAFLVRHMHTASGINITASHNPKEYNGYKVYWEDGCQISGSVSDKIAEHINSIDMFDGVRSVSYDDGIKSGMITVLGEKEDKEYMDTILKLAVNKAEDLDLSIPFVYTPLNGAGSIPFREMLKRRGFSNWHIVEEQSQPDPDFTTVGYPNPEDPKAFKLSEKLGKEVGAELLMATDPDSDRFAIELLDSNGNYVPLNGNQTGYLLLNYILEGKKTAGTLPKNGAIVRSIVTSPLSNRIAEAYGCKLYESLTGFKNICGRIPFLEKNNLQYLFGYEESVGYAACPDIRDKDGISAGMLVAEAAAYFRKQGKTLFDVLNDIYKTYGCFAEDEPNIILEGLEGKKQIADAMVRVRNNPFTEVAGVKVSNIIDYDNGYEDIPASNVLRFDMENGCRFFIRPSGTEPKLKFYFYSVAETTDKAKELNKAFKEDVLKKLGF